MPLRTIRRPGLATSGGDLGVVTKGALPEEMEPLQNSNRVWCLHR